MFSSFTSIPISTRCHIRHVRVFTGSLVICFEDDVSICYRLIHALQLLPGLKLDKLTVLNFRSVEFNHEEIDLLIRYSNGWKQLRFLSADVNFPSLKYKYVRNMTKFSTATSIHFEHLSQPTDWQHALERRDWPTSNSSVRIYRVSAQDSEYKNSVLLTSTKEILVVANRGTGVDYSEKEGSPYLRVNGRDLCEPRGMKYWTAIDGTWLPLDDACAARRFFRSMNTHKGDLGMIDYPSLEDADLDSRSTARVTRDYYQHVDDYDYKRYPDYTASLAG